MSDIDHPAHYKAGGVEAIDVIEAWGLGFCLGNVVKYISRAGRKDPDKTLEDLQKAAWYLSREIAKLADKTVNLDDIHTCDTCRHGKFKLNDEPCSSCVEYDRYEEDYSK